MIFSPKPIILFGKQYLSILLANVNPIEALCFLSWTFIFSMCICLTHIASQICTNNSALAMNILQSRAKLSIFWTFEKKRVHTTLVCVLFEAGVDILWETDHVTKGPLWLPQRFISITGEQYTIYKWYIISEIVQSIPKRDAKFH